MAKGTYSLTERAYDDELASTKSSPVVVTVVSPGVIRQGCKNLGQNCLMRWFMDLSDLDGVRHHFAPVAMQAQ